MQRQTPVYTSKEYEFIRLAKDKFIIEMEELELEEKLKIYNNQKYIAEKVVEAFRDKRVLNVMVLSKTQSGKTGSMCAVIEKYSRENFIPIKNIYIITGISSVDWLEQTKERVPHSLHGRIFHRQDLMTTFVDEILSKTNVLIIMDEIQVAAKTTQTLFKAFESAGLLHKLYERDVKIIEYTATPDGTVYDQMGWKDASVKIMAEPGVGYTSSYKLLVINRVRQYKDLTNIDNVREIRNVIDENYKNDYRYHIIRTKKPKTGHKDKQRENIKLVFSDYKIETYDGLDKKDLNEILSKKPIGHTIILIKEKLRCAKTITKKNLGILYERWTQRKPDDGCIIQGLIGRLTGYDYNGDSICFTNLDTIRRYNALWSTQFNDKNIEWNSKTTKTINGITNSTGTLIEVVNYSELSDTSDVSDSSDDDDSEKIMTEVFYGENGQDELINHCREVLKTPGPRKIVPEDGYYRKIIRSKSKILSCDAVNNDLKNGLSKEDKKLSYRWYPCYSDINKKETLQWWLVHK